jgi:putative aldouronate transport system permease protein
MKHKDNKSKSDRALSIVTYVIISAFTIICLYPLVLTLMVALSDEHLVELHGFKLIPMKFSTYAFQYLWKNNSKDILHSYFITISVTVIGTLLALLVTSMMAYAMSQRYVKFRNIISLYSYITVIFSAGIVPWYIVCVNYLHITDSFQGLIFPYLVNVWNLFLLRNYFQSIPDSLIESAKIDGANDLLIFFRLILPLAKTSMLTVGLFYALQYWNDWWLSIMLINKSELFPLQYYLYNILSSAQALTNNPAAGSVHVVIPSETIKMTVTIVTIGPIIFLYPFVQKYFVKGIMVGAIKE